MMRYRMLVRILATSLIVLSAVVGVMAGVCQGAGMPAPAEHQRGHAHHDGLHAALCTLACQANLALGLVSSIPDVHRLHSFVGTIMVSLFFGRLVQPTSIRPRAPPSALPVR